MKSKLRLRSKNRQFPIMPSWLIRAFAKATFSQQSISSRELPTGKSLMFASLIDAQIDRNDKVIFETIKNSNVE